MSMTTASPHTPRRFSRGWPSFIALSLLIHLALLWLLTSPPAFSPTANPLTVRLLGAPSATAPATSPREQAARAVTPPPSIPRTVATPPSPTEQAATPDKPLAAVNPVVMPLDERRFDGNSVRFGQDQNIELSSAEQRSDPVEDALRSQIRTRFSEHFHYPLLAQRRNLEGVVVLAFRVGRDGTLSDIAIAQSSGFALLDDAALDSLRAIERLEFEPGTALQRTLELRMPVVYHLADE